MVRFGSIRLAVGGGVLDGFGCDRYLGDIHREQWNSYPARFVQTVSVDGVDVLRLSGDFDRVDVQRGRVGLLELDPQSIFSQPVSPVGVVGLGGVRGRRDRPLLFLAPACRARFDSRIRRLICCVVVGRSFELPSPENSLKARLPTLPQLCSGG